MKIVSANEKKRYMCKVFSHWLRLFSCDLKLMDKTNKDNSSSITFSTLSLYGSGPRQMKTVSANERRRYIYNIFSHHENVLPDMRIKDRNRLRVHSFSTSYAITARHRTRTWRATHPSNYCPQVTWKRSPPMNGRRRYICSVSSHGPLSRYVTLRVEHAPGMPGTFSPPPRVSDPDMHHSTCVTHVSWCMPGSLTSGFLWSRWRGKRSRHSWSMHNPQFYVSGKRPIGWNRSRDDLRATHNNWT